MYIPSCPFLYLGPNTALETRKDCLRSIIAQLFYRHKILDMEKQGQNFLIFAYQPEIDKVTGQPFHEREDHNHVLKVITPELINFCLLSLHLKQRIASHTRSGGPEGCHLERLQEAMESPETCLTYVALSGQKKQKVEDAERIFSKSVAQYLRQRGYTNEVVYVQTVCNWHVASDGRAISQLKRCKYNYEMLQYVLDELMPWHRQSYDFSYLEVNQ